MKKFYLIAAFLLIVSAGKSFAQTTQTVNLNITLQDVVSLTVSTNTRSYVFDTEAKYTNGIKDAVSNHLEVLSSRNYRIDVQAGTITGTSALPADGVILTPANGAAGNFGGLTAFAPVTLSTAAAAPLITSSQSSFNAGGSKTQFNMEYHVGANQKFAGLTAATNNVIPVIYTITQP